MHVGDASLDESLCLLRMLALADGMAAYSKFDNRVAETLSHFVKIDEKTSGISVNIQRLVQVFAMVDLLDKLNDDIRDTIHLFLLTHEIDLVVKRLCHLKDRMDEECIVQFVWARAIEAQHLLTQRLLHVGWEVVE